MRDDWTPWLNEGNFPWEEYQYSYVEVDDTGREIGAHAIRREEFGSMHDANPERVYLIGQFPFHV
ncbi:MAG: hypothetical protein WD907_05915 [Bacilli bacterium]